MDKLLQLFPYPHCDDVLLHSSQILRSQENGWHLADGIFKLVFVNENKCIFIQISLKFVPKVLITNMRTLI